MLDIKVLEMAYFCNGYNVPYTLKNGGDILIKPILVKDYNVYEWAKQILQINKNEINDIEIIQMSYLDFLIEKIFSKSEECTQQLQQIINLCLDEQYIAFQKSKGKNCICICDENSNVKKIINSKEFDEISKIILNQNDFNYDDRELSKDVKEAYEEYCKLKYSDIGSPSLEKMKAFVTSKTGLKLNEINEMVYRYFSLVYHSAVDSEIYIGEKIIQGSYKYKVDKNIMHPQYEKKKDPIAEMFSDASAFENKIQQMNQ